MSLASNLVRECVVVTVSLAILGGTAPAQRGITRTASPTAVETASVCPINSIPGHNESLWRTQNNIVLIEFDADLISVPESGEVLVQELLPDGLYGPDQSANFNFFVEGARVLRVKQNGAVLDHEKWYAVRNPGTWAGACSFELHFVVHVGDASNDNRVTFGDLSDISSVVGVAGPESRADIDGDGFFASVDILLACAHVPSFSVLKPNGHVPGRATELLAPLNGSALSRAASASFSPIGPTSVQAGTDVVFNVTLTSDLLGEFDAADVVIGSDGAADLALAYAEEWTAAMVLVCSTPVFDSGFYAEDVFAGGFSQLPGPSLLLGTLTVGTSGLQPGTYSVSIDFNNDNLSQLYMDGQDEPITGAAGFTVVPGPGACCLPDATCIAPVTFAECESQGGSFTEGVRCACRANPSIPAVGELGMAVMIVVILVVGCLMSVRMKQRKAS